MSHLSHPLPLAPMQVGLGCAVALQVLGDGPPRSSWGTRTEEHGLLAFPLPLMDCCNWAVVAAAERQREMSWVDLGYRSLSLGSSASWAPCFQPQCGLARRPLAGRSCPEGLMCMATQAQVTGPHTLCHSEDSRDCPQELYLPVISLGQTSGCQVEGNLTCDGR